MPNIPGLGVNTWMQLAKETTYGVAPAAATARYDILTAEPNLEVSTIKDPSMNAQFGSRRAVIPGLQWFTGTVKLVANFYGMEELLRAVFPSYTYSAGLKQHTFKEGTALNSYTLEFNYGDRPTANKCMRITGVFFTKLKIIGGTAGEGGLIHFELDYCGLLPNHGITPMTAATQPVPHRIPFHYATAASLQEGSGASVGNMNIRSFDIEFVLPHNDQRAGLANIAALPPIRKGMYDCTWNVEEEFTDTLLFNAAKNNSQILPLFIQFKQPANWDGTNFRTIQFQSRNVTAAKFKAPIPGPQEILQTITYECAYDPTDASALMIQTINEQAQLV